MTWQENPLPRLLVRHEGIRLRPYTDTVGKLTIGIGRNLDDKGITEDEALYLLRNDVEEARRGLDKAIPWWLWLDEVRQAVLLDMAFNMGVRGLLGFIVTLPLIQEGRYAEAADAMLKSKWARQVKGRAAELAVMMRTGQWPAWVSTPAGGA